MSRTFPLATLGALVLIVSCFPGKAPNVTPTNTLELGREGDGTSLSRPFGVVFASPKGATRDPSAVTVVFSRPLRPLETAGNEPPVPARIAIKGTNLAPNGDWRWLGTHAFVFSGDLPRATEFDVTVPAATKALDGTPLGSDYTFAFRTALPEIVRVEPGDGYEHLTPTQRFDVRLDQPVDLREIERAAKLVVGERSIPVRASWPKSDQTHAFVELTPTQRLPLASKVDLVFDASLRGTEGSLPMGTRKTVTMHTYGPLVVSKVDCLRDNAQSKCYPGASVRVELSNAAVFKDVRRSIRVEPAVPIEWGTLITDDEKVSSFALPARLRPSRSYRIIVSPGLRDEYGQTLTDSGNFTVETDDFAPAAEIGLEGQVFEPSFKPRTVPVTSVNVPQLEVVSAALTEDSLVGWLFGAAEHENPSQRFDRATRTPGANVDRSTPGTRRNVDSVQQLPFDSLLGTSGRGAVLLGLRYTSKRGRPVSNVHTASVTDLGVTAHMSRFGSVVWVSRLSNAKPVPGATVTLRTKAGERFRGTSDAQGLVTIPSESYSPITANGSVDEEAVLVVRDGTDWAFRKVSENLDPWRYDAPSDIAARLPTLGMVFTDRGIYRAGESLKVRGLFRRVTPKGTETPKGRDVRLDVFDAAGDKFASLTAKVDAFGEVGFDVAIPATVRLGTGELRAEIIEPKTEDRSERTATGTFQLAAYKAAEFKVTVDPSKTSYIRGDRADCTVHGDYLFGAPMGGGPVRLTATRGMGSFVPPGSDDLVVDDSAFASGLPDANMRAGVFATKAGALDSKGSYTSTVALVFPEQRGAEMLTLEAEVTDISRQSIAGRTSVVVHPGEFYVGLKPPKEWFLSAGSTLNPEVVALEPSGRRRAGVRVQVDLVKRTWHSVMVATGGSAGHYESRAVDVVAHSCDVTTAAAPVSCTLALDDVGYFFARATAKDGRGNALAASTSVYVIGDNAAPGWRISDSTQLELVADKKSYEVGDTARILIKSPYREAEALVTVERAGVYRSERRTLVGATPTITVPITEELRPNAFVSVHLVRGRSKATPVAGPDVGAPAFRLGYADLRVNPEARRLKVGVASARKEYRPGDEVQADVVVTDRAGKPARSEVTFYAVDEGVLMLTGYKTPDPLPVFSAPRPLAVFGIDSRSDLGHIALAKLGETGLDKGGEGGDGGGMSRRADFKSTAYFEPALVTNDSGKVHVRFKLPDNLTTYRLMAVAAAEDDRFGFGEAQIVTSRPLMARPALPRFLRAGDTIEAGVVVTSKGMAAQKVELSLTAQGATVTGDTKRTVSLPASGSMEVRWPIAVTQAGTAKLVFRASGSGETDEVEVSRTVQTPLALESVALYGETREAAGERLGDLGAMRTDVGGLDLRVASTALVGLSGGVEQLIEYPYGCTEQLTSRLVPLLPLRSLATDFGLKLPQQIDKVVDDTLAKILLNQNGDGSFGYWRDSPEGDPWVTAYALWGLEIGKAAGRYVPAEAIERATRYVRKRLEDDKPRDLGLVERAFIVDVLASVGKADPGYASTLFEQRANMPLFARALLAHAMGLMKMPSAKELLPDLEQHLRVTPVGATVVDNVGDRYARLLDSEGRTTAMVLRALTQVAPNHALVSRLARGLLGMRQGGRWRSTQETAWALLALDDYRKTREAASPDFDAVVYLAKDELFKASFHERTALEASTSLAASKVFGQGGGVLAFQVQGKGTLFYEARLRYARRELPKDPLDRGFYIRKMVRRVTPDKLREALKTLPAQSATSVAGGDLVLVDLLVVTPDPREQVVVEDPLPAGLEAIDARLQTSSRSLGVGEAGGEGDSADTEASDDNARSGGQAYNFAWYHREIRDDRVLTFVEHMAAGMYHYRYLARATTFGRYVVPPTRVEAMYQPEVFGRTGASVFEVKE